MAKKRGDKILSQDEIDALFKAMQEGKKDADSGPRPAAPPPKKIVKYDVRKPDRISKDQIRSLHLIHNYFQRSFSSSLSAYLRAFVEIKLVSIEQITYSEFLEYISEPTCYNSINMSPLEGNMVMELSYPVVFPMLDLMLGGTGLPPKEERAITDIEWSIFDGVIHLAMKDLREAWKPVVDLDLRVTARDSKPQMLQFVSLSEPVVAIGLEVRIGNNSGSMNLGIPSIMLKLIRHKFEQQAWAMRRKEDIDRDKQRLRHLLPSLPVELTAEIRGTSITIRDFLELNAGDVISLDHYSDKPVIVAIEGRPYYLGHVVAHQEHKGILLETMAGEKEMM